MRRTSILIPALVAVSAGMLLGSCRNKQPHNEAYVHQGWKTLDVAGWTIQAPEGYEVTFAEGSGSVPGSIISAKDKVEIHFDVWREPGADLEDCDEDMLTENIEGSLASSEEFYAADIEHKVWLDTINGRYAVLTKPLKTGKGTVSVHFDGCHHSLAMSADFLSKEQESVVMEMFRTIDYPAEATRR